MIKKLQSFETGGVAAKVTHYSQDAAQTKVSITPAAVSYVQQHIAKRGRGIGLRLAVKKSGCSGYKYVVEDVDEPAPKDYIFPFTENLAIYVDPQSYLFVQGTQIDFQQDGVNGRLIFHNPNESSSCGCGESFGVG